MQQELLILGCGDTGKRLLPLLEEKRFTISAVSHTPESQAKLRKLNINVISADLDNPASLSILTTAHSYIFYFAPPAALKTTDNRMLNFIAQLKKSQPPKRIVYISTSGVYGNSNGQWITESFPINPGNDRSKRRLHAETCIKEYCKNNSCEFVILRVTGIYCLEKLPFERLKDGMKVLHPEIAPFSNRIHADDLATCCVKAMLNSPANEIYNVADGNPSSISDYFIQISHIFNLPKPELLNWDRAEKEISPAMLSYLHESKKISNDKLLKQLDITLRYPNLGKGLQACADLKSTLKVSI